MRELVKRASCSSTTATPRRRTAVLDPVRLAADDVAMIVGLCGSCYFYTIRCDGSFSQQAGASPRAMSLFPSDPPSSRLIISSTRVNQFHSSAARSAQYDSGSRLAISSISRTRPSAASPAFVRYLSRVSAPALLRNPVRRRRSAPSAGNPESWRWRWPPNPPCTRTSRTARGAEPKSLASALSASITGRTVSSGLRELRRPFANASLTITSIPDSLASSNAAPADCSMTFHGLDAVEEFGTVRRRHRHGFSQHIRLFHPGQREPDLHAFTRLELAQL